MNNPASPSETIEADRTLELSGEQLRTLVDAAMQRVSVYLDSLSEQPSFNVDGADEMARSLVETLQVEE